MKGEKEKSPFRLQKKKKNSRMLKIDGVIILFCTELIYISVSVFYMPPVFAVKKALVLFYRSAGWTTLLSREGKKMREKQNCDLADST